MGTTLFYSGDPGRAQRYLEQGIPLEEECGEHQQPGGCPLIECSPTMLARREIVNPFLMA